MFQTATQRSPREVIRTFQKPSSAGRGSRPRSRERPQAPKAIAFRGLRRAEHTLGSHSRRHQPQRLEPLHLLPQEPHHPVPSAAEAHPREPGRSRDSIHR